MENVTKRRDRHDIVAEILKTAKEGKIKTHIMYKARLSYAQIYEYLDLLAKKGFLENTKIERKRKISTMYRTTQKGIDLLNHIESANKLFE
ncbi:MAG: winged helix-turn-helix domain-containing protein [Candidatus Bathyarchaeia archaeon]